MIPILWATIPLSCLIAIIAGTHHAPGSIIYFPQRSFSPVHLAVNKFEDLLILVVAARAWISHPVLWSIIHDEEARVANPWIIDAAHVGPAPTMLSMLLLVGVLWNVIVIFGKGRARCQVLAYDTARWMHLSHRDHAVNWAWYGHPLDTFTWLEVVVLPVNHVWTIILPDIRIICLTIQSRNR